MLDPFLPISRCPMPFSRTQLDDLRTGIHAARTASATTEWERRFLQDMEMRLDRYGTKTRLSAKQYALLMRLAGGNSSAPAQASSASGQFRRSRAADHRTAKKRGHSMANIRKHWGREPSGPTSLLIIGAVLFFAVIFSSSEEAAAPIRPGASPETFQPTQLRASQIRVVDGDTVDLPGYDQNIRLVGFNTPEVFSPGCKREADLGRMATDRLQDLLAERLADRLRGSGLRVQAGDPRHARLQLRASLRDIEG